MRIPLLRADTVVQLSHTRLSARVGIRTQAASLSNRLAYNLLRRDYKLRAGGASAIRTRDLAIKSRVL